MIEHFATGCNYGAEENPINNKGWVSVAAAKQLKPNSVIILKAPSDRYNVDDLNALQDYYRKLFPNHTVCVMWNDIDIEIVHDHSLRKERPCAALPDEYYY